MTVYHIIRKDKPQYELGQIIVSPFEKVRDFSHWKPYKNEAEKLLEKKRLDNFSHLPSRYNCLFVADSLERIEEWVRSKYRMGAIYYLYELELINGSIYYFDTDWFEGLGELLSNGELPITHKYSIEECVTNFWNGVPYKASVFSLKEGMLKGTVKVISKKKFKFDRFLNQITEI